MSTSNKTGNPPKRAKRATSNGRSSDNKDMESSNTPKEPLNPPKRAVFKGTTPKEQAREMPESPGVYLMYSKKNVVLYVGKAKNLRNRVTSYFVKNQPPKTAALVSNIHRIESIITSNELDALVLENNLIKTHLPKYNIDLKDSATYPYIRLTADRYPRIFITRKVIKDGSTYFGPYPKVAQIHTYLDIVDAMYPLRKCRGTLPKRSSPCLYYHINKCKAPCVEGYQSEGEYQSFVERHLHLLKGNVGALRRSVEEQMKEASSRLAFEEAATYRDMLRSLEMVQSGSGVEDFNLDSRDYLAQVREEEFSIYSIIRMREGKVKGKDVFSTQSIGTRSEGVEEFVMHYYENPGAVPKHLYVDGDREECVLLAEYLSQLAGRKIEVLNPQRGRHRAILQMARENGRMELQKNLRTIQREEPLKLLQEQLNLPELPLRIDGYDISHLAGKYTIAAMVCLIGGVPAKGEYRYFTIRSLNGGIDDFKALKEATARRYSRVIHDNLDPPQLILIDGGVGQVSGVESILAGLELDIPVVGLAKEDEEIILPKSHKIVKLPPGDPALQVLQRARDEAHRFATSLNQRIRTKKDGTFSMLETIPGIGPKRSKQLLKTYGSLENITKQIPSKMAEDTGLSEEVAERVVSYVKEATSPL